MSDTTTTNSNVVVSVKRTKKAWHVARSFKKKKDADGRITVSKTPGPTLKVWARQQIEENSLYAEDCKIWLYNKAHLARKSLSK